jgi:hypothetical protein
MALKLNKCVLSFLCLVLTSCLWGGKERFKQVNLKTQEQKLEIPSDLWDLIESMYSGENALRPVGEKVESKIPFYSIIKKRSKVQTPLKYMDLKVRLIENNYGTLGRKDYQLNYPLGGGLLDFANYVKVEEGSFRIEVEMGLDTTDAEQFRVFYWGNGKRRKIDGDVFGSGCKNVHELTGFFKTKVFVRGLAATTHRRKYVTTLAGTYVFVVKKGGALYISQLTMQDSRYGFLQCRN